MGGEKQMVGEREGETRSGETLSLHSTPFPHHLYCDLNQRRIQADQQVNRCPPPNSKDPTHTLNPRLRQDQAPTSTDICVNQNTEKGVAKADVSKQMYSSTGTTAPPTEEQNLSIKMRAPPTASIMSSLYDERQNELQYYIAKVFIHTHTHAHCYCMLYYTV